MREHHFEISAMVRAFVAPFCILLVLGIIEVISHDMGVRTIPVDIVLCIVWIIVEIGHQKGIPLEKVKAYQGMYIAFTLFADGVLLGLIDLYVDNWYRELMGDYGILAGIQWFIYMIVIWIAQIFLIIHGIVAIVKAKRSNKST